MTVTQQIGKHLKDLHTGGNWTTVNFKAVLAETSYNDATFQLAGFNTIAALAYHCHYYVQVILDVLEGKPLQGNDAISFQHPTIESEMDWSSFLSLFFEKADALAQAISALPDELLAANFVADKYGTYYRNFQGMIEHSHYHLGQIVILKKLIQQQ